MRYDVDTTDLLKVAKWSDDVQLATRPAVAKALNDFGETVVDVMAEAIEEATNLEASVIREQMIVYQADASDLTWEVDASAVTPRGSDWEARPWRVGRDHTFDGPPTLLNIVNYDDDACPICKDVAEDSPYTVEEINMMAENWANWTPETPVAGERSNLIHPNCRCMTQPWRSQKRRIGVTMGGRGAAQRMTATELGKAVAGQMRVVIRARERE